MSKVVMGLADLDSPSLQSLPSALQLIAGPECGLGTLLNRIIAVANQGSSSVGATRVVTYGGTATADDELTITIDGEAYTHIVVDGTTATTAATEMRTALNLDPTFAARWLATNTAGAITIAALQKGVQGNAFSFVASKVGTGTFVAAGALMTGGSGANDIAPIV